MSGVDPHAGVRSLASADLLVSLQVPVDWEPTDAAADLLEVSGPVPTDRVGDGGGDGDGDGYRTTLTVRGGEAAAPGRDWWRDFSASVAEQLVTDDPLLELDDLDLFRLSSQGAEVVLLRLRRAADPDGLPPLGIVQAWVWAGSHRMLVVGGSTAAVRAATDVPRLEAVVRSLRLLPLR